MSQESESSQPVQRDRFLKLTEVERLTTLKKTTIYELQKKKEFPHCVMVTPRSVAWRESQVLQWMQDRPVGPTSTQCVAL